MRMAIFLFLYVMYIYVYFSSEADDDHGNSTADTTSSEKSEALMEAAQATTAIASANNSTDKPVHKWPIRPGVHVHVNGLHMLNNSSTSGEQISGFTYGTKNNSSVCASSDTASEKDRGVDEVACSGVNQCSETGTGTVANRGTSTNDIITSNHQKDSTNHQQAASKNAMTSEAIHNNSNTYFYFPIFKFFFSFFVHEFLFLEIIFFS